LIALLFALQAYNWFGPPPAAVDVRWSAMGLFFYGLAALFASWVARNRIAR
jgi:hypothetical protein